MIDFRPISFVIGALLATLGVALIIPTLMDLAVGNDNWRSFAAASLVTLFTGVALSVSQQVKAPELSIRQAFLLTTLAWVSLTAFSALPFVWSDMKMGYTDAYFEAMSGLTTTGATVITQLDERSPGILLWRGILQWLGGVGIIVMALAVMPMLQIGGMQLFRTESSDNSEKIVPRAAQLASTITAVYVFLSLLCVIGYLLSGMSLFDAIVHSMTTLATGGLSSHDASFGYFKSDAVLYVAIIFMICGSLPFGLYLYALNGRVNRLFKDSQVRWFLAILSVFIFTAWLSQFGPETPIGGKELLSAAFHATSIMTGTGYAMEDYGAWSTSAEVLFFSMMFVGGCAGSASCGIKIFRIQVLVEAIKQRTFAVIQPNGIYVPRYNGRPIDDRVMTAVLCFIFLFLLCFAVITFLISLYGIDLITAISATAACITNVGPGLGDIVGPSGNFQPLPEGVKWLLSLAMLLGRLELFTVLVLFVPTFWRS
ncbi:MAG: Trk system potassium uptake protein [Rhodomicrobium sp.]|nr:MAG: Trk system potassium uptake protein [Rhodomicrobium sp.]